MGLYATQSTGTMRVGQERRAPGPLERPTGRLATVVAGERYAPLELPGEIIFEIPLAA
jgi:hypothetical protein